jgi:branched-chain amino acid transport system substrate-binding protein
VVSYFERLLEFLHKNHHVQKSAYIIVQDVLWTRQTGNALKIWLNKHGWDVGGFDIYPMGSTDFSSSLFRIRLKGSKIVLAFFDMPESGILIKQMHSMRLGSILCGIISPAIPEYAWDIMDGAVEGLLGFVLEPGPIPIKKIPASVHFNNEYGKFWGEKVRKRLSCHGAGGSYDAVYVLVKAMEKAGSTDPEKVIEELERTDMYGVVGRIRFSKEHQLIFGDDPNEAAVGCIFQWRRPGIRIPVFAPSISEAGIIVVTN